MVSITKQPRWGQQLLLPILLGVGFAACVKNTELTPVGTTTNPVKVTDPTAAIDTTGQKLLAKGAFVNAVHTVKGTVSLYEKGGKRTLVFTDFSTDGGPDLRIYVAEDKALTNFLEVTKLTTTGNFALDLPTGYDPTRHKTVLVWCKAFSVLFGAATLQ